jgi:metallo-beta-lactamase family protein
MQIEFLGGAQTVTGSKHLLRTDRAAVLLECGLFQGHRREAVQRNRTLPFDAGRVDAVVLSHAHIDHSGALPRLVRGGYRGSIWMTPATRDLCVPMLEDAAAIQEADARHIASLIARGVDLEPVEPLYGRRDVAEAAARMVGLPYRRPQPIAPGVTVTFLDAGHVLGSAVVVLDVEERGARHRLAFTGDLGRHHLPILRDPEVPGGAGASAAVVGAAGPEAGTQSEGARGSASDQVVASSRDSRRTSESPANRIRDTSRPGANRATTFGAEASERSTTATPPAAGAT